MDEELKRARGFRRVGGCSPVVLPQVFVKPDLDRLQVSSNRGLIYQLLPRLEAILHCLS